ncbi:Rne/Rng family ribonuclease [Thermoclostridium caenicola]|uniref:RNAse G n=1 Tax=Thermoclostridium caenicola TaxID=659425 RepID=A0A1M6BUL9_9FIRM|nr:Rne/Rng family ribonuclease [Thermoclostridium caenicola]SHI52198.1 RNAse G [Thermoclostridium caenicola]HOL84739.1 Rne/Rng family ribonuclease [Thermoclostridium caenicola]HOP73069.1 Rne/Rng family ribonuclease [Thermoclostridium caenicola]HPO75792.1 Rne/Rng family ribonuclease [Thermoclostridium caenicola]
MTKDVLMDASMGQIRLAVMEDGELVEFYVEEREKESMLGNIYRGRVERVVPGMQAAFIDIGLSRNAFLYVRDLLTDGDQNNLSGALPPIGHLLKAGQELTVQVVKEMSGQKGPRVTTRITLPGRFAVLLPNQDTAGISKRLDDGEERKRLKELARALKPEGAGLIIRTAARHVPVEWLKDEIESLIGKWNRILEQQSGGPVPRCLYQETDFVSHMIREHLTPDLNRFIVNDREIWEQVNRLLDSDSPGFRPRVEYFDRDYDLFDYYQVESAISQALSRKVYLKSGGYLVFDRTEALTVIDVNSGKYVGRTSLEDTALKINTEAVETIARQVRLRDLGGIIIIDFIDMQDKSHREEVVARLKEAVKRDRTQTVVVGMTGLGLVEMTRKKVRQPLADYLTVDCRCCGGTGRHLSPMVVAKRVERRMARYLMSNHPDSLEILVHPDIHKVLEGQEKDRLVKLGEQYACQIRITPSTDVAYGDMRMREGP